MSNSYIYIMYVYAVSLERRKSERIQYLFLLPLILSFFCPKLCHPNSNHFFLFKIYIYINSHFAHLLYTWKKKTVKQIKNEAMGFSN